MSKNIFSLLILFILLASLFMVVEPITAASPNSWVSKASMHVARSDLGVAVLNGKIYAISGTTESGYIPNNEGNDYKAKGWITNVNEEYDPLTDSWSFKTPIPTPRYNFAITAYQNKIYCMGGIINWHSGNISYTAVNEVYDPARDSWETKAPMPIATSAQANVVGGIIYLVGGGSDDTITQAYNSSTDSWAIKKSMPTASNSPPPNTLSTLFSVVLDNKVYVMSYSGHSSLNWVYNPVNDSWRSEISSSPRFLKEGNWWSQAAVATTGIMATKQIYVFFARYPYSTYLPNSAYELSVGTWMAAASVPTYRQNFGVVVLDDIIYAIGGRTYDYPYPDDNYFTVSEQAANEQYSPVGYGTPDPSYVSPIETIPPKISALSPLNQTYNESSISLLFTLDKPVNWTGYCIDGKDKVTITGNTTLSGLSNGVHNVTVYAKDSFGNIGASETINFTVASEPFPTVLVAAASTAFTAIACVGVILCLRKRKG